MTVRAIRGATTVENNDSEEMLKETTELLNNIIEANELDVKEIISIFFTVTKDLDAVFPAIAARDIGLTEAALMCANEMVVPGSIEKCIRVMLHVNTNKEAKDIKHIYLKGAKILRPDLN